MTSTAIVTIVSNNYLHFARTLLQSVALHHPEAKRYCVIVDRDPAPASQLTHEFQAIALEQLHLPDGPDFLFQYTVLELNTAVKPWAMQHLLRQGHDHVIYIDPDICLYQPLTEVQQLLGQGADIVLTPHLLDPIADDCRPTELDIRRAGTYNLGFCAVRQSDNTHRYLQWWQGKLHRDCVVAVDKGIFVDQSWMDLVPGMFERVAVLRHPGYNIAYWNLAQRTVSLGANSQPLASGQPLVFFHYSGLNPQSPHNVSKHQNRFTFENINPATRSLFEAYAQAAIANGAASYSRLPYGFDQYSNSTPITSSQRARFRTDPVLRQQCQGNPFDHPELLSPHHMPATAATLQLHVDPAHTYRLQHLYQQLLGRLPERAALAARGSRMQTRSGMVRAVLGVGLSTEARSTPGWQARLLRLANEVHLTPRPIKTLLTQPAERLLRLASRHWPSLAWRPPGVPHIPITDTHLVIRPQRVSAAPQTAPEQLQAPAGINLVGYLAAELGVGEAARSLARACAAAQVPFSATDVGYQSQNLQRDTSILQLAQPQHYPIDLLYVNADQTATTTQQLQASGRPQPAYTIGFWHWEQPVLPVHLHSAFAHLDEVWVPSTFVHDAIAPISPVPVFKVPHALQFQPTPGTQRSQFGLPAGQQLVLVMYDFHSYQYRKNPQAAIAAYRLAAQHHPQLTLVIKTINSQHHPQAFEQLQASVQDLPNVIFINSFLTRQQVWDLQSVCDILLSLHRAEGFGLAPAEMMYLGKPVVATGWSANMDFMTAANSMPVSYQLKPLEHDLGAYPPGPLWAEADIEHAAFCLGQLASDPSLAQRLGSQAAQDIHHQLSPATVGQQIRQRLQMLGHWYPHLLPATAR